MKRGLEERKLKWIAREDQGTNSDVSQTVLYHKSNPRGEGEVNEACERLAQEEGNNKS